MSNDVWATMEATPLEELRRRAAIIGELAEVEPVTVDGAVRYGWNDGGGQSTVWYFTADRRVLLLTLDHEKDLNLLDEDNEDSYSLQERFYDGVPEDLVQLVRNRPENYESLNLTDWETEDTIHLAGGVFWYDGTRWHVTEGVADHCRREGLDLFRESGFDYCLRPYQFGRDLTPDWIIQARAVDGYHESEAALARIRETFARHA